MQQPGIVHRTQSLQYGDQYIVQVVFLYGLRVFRQMWCEIASRVVFHHQVRCTVGLGVLVYPGDIRIVNLCEYSGFLQKACQGLFKYGLLASACADFGDWSRTTRQFRRQELLDVDNSVSTRRCGAIECPERGGRADFLYFVCPN